MNDLRSLLLLPAEGTPVSSTSISAMPAVVLPTMYCRTCVERFESADLLRQHYRSKHSQVATGATADTKVDVDDTQSGEESSEGEAAVIDAIEDGAGNDEDDTLASSTTGPAAGPLVPIVLQGRRLRVHRGLLLTSGNPSVVAAASERGLARPAEIHVSRVDLIVPGEVWAVLLLSSGYFAVAAFQMAPGIGEASEASDGTAASAWPRPLFHKRFSHYTTRRKQGGSQSAHDAAKGRAAQSAGAQLRRFGEVALAADVARMVAARPSAAGTASDGSGGGGDAVWHALLGGARRVLYAAPRAMAPQLWADGSTLRRGDPRLARVPFAVGRPSLAEATRVAKMLATVYAGDAGDGDADAHAGNAVETKAPDDCRTVTVTGTRRGGKARIRDDDGAEEADATGAAATRKSSSARAAHGISNASAAAAAASAKAAQSAAAISGLEAAILRASILRQRSLGEASDSSSDEASDSESGLAAAASRAKAATPSLAISSRKQNKKASVAATEGTDDYDDDDAALEAALNARAIEARYNAALADELSSARQLRLDLETNAESTADSLRVPVAVLHHALGWEATVPTLQMCGMHGVATPEGISRLRKAIHRRSEMLDLYHTLAQAGMRPWEAAEAMGWAQLAAGLLAASLGERVNWAYSAEEADAIGHALYADLRRPAVAPSEGKAGSAGKAVGKKGKKSRGGKKKAAPTDARVPRLVSADEDAAPRGGSPAAAVRSFVAHGAGREAQPSPEARRELIRAAAERRRAAETTAAAVAAAPLE